MAKLKERLLLDYRYEHFVEGIFLENELKQTLDYRRVDRKQMYLTYELVYIIHEGEIHYYSLFIFEMFTCLKSIAEENLKCPRIKDNRNYPKL